MAHKSPQIRIEAISADSSLGELYDFDIETVWQKCDEYNNWILEKRIMTEVWNMGKAGVRKKTTTNWWRRDISYFET